MNGNVTHGLPGLMNGEMPAPCFQTQFEELLELMGLTEEEQAIRDLLNLPGFVITGLKAIGKFMNVSTSTISRWGVRFRGRTETLLCFPLIMFPTGKGLAWTYKTNTSLIAAWMLRWAIIDARERQTGKPRKTITIGQRQSGGRLDREEAGPDPEDPHPQTSPLPPERPCPCSRCNPHLHPEAAKIERVYWEPPLTSEPLPESPMIRRREGCLCGTGLFCAVCDN